MAWLEVFAVAMVTVAEVSFMPRSLPERMQNVQPSNKDKVFKLKTKNIAAVFILPV